MDELSEDDKLTVSRARKIQRFLSQPFSVAEVFTGKEGKLVPLDVSVCVCVCVYMYMYMYRMYKVMVCVVSVSSYSAFAGHDFRLQEDY